MSEGEPLLSAVLLQHMLVLQEHSLISDVRIFNRRHLIPLILVGKCLLPVVLVLRNVLNDFFFDEFFCITVVLCKVFDASPFGTQPKLTSTILRYWFESLEQAASYSAENISGFNEETPVFIACDVSGSMNIPISQRSSIANYDIGILLASVLRSKCKSVVTGLFGET